MAPDPEEPAAAAPKEPAADAPTALRLAAAELPIDHLDMIRGVAALVVLGWHWRNLFYEDYHKLVDPSLAVQAFYFGTGYGNEAVMVFFVLSGYFIGSSVLHSVKHGIWSWRGYLINRLTRLYVVLLPAIPLGVAWDLGGLAVFGPVGSYVGDFAQLGPTIITWPVAERLTIPIALANLLFLQGIVAPPLGSNGPLWSLAYEWWYYVLFPVAVLALSRSVPTAHRVGYVLLAAAIIALMGPVMASYIVVWLLGVLVSVAPVPAFTRTAWYKWGGLALTGLLFVAVASLARAHVLPRTLGTDFLTGITFAGLLYVILTSLKRTHWPRYTAIAGALAGFSYTLYLVHNPALLFFSTWLRGDHRWYADLPHVAAGLGVCLVMMAYAWVVHKLTEAHTPRVRHWFLHHAPGRRTDRPT